MAFVSTAMRALQARGWTLTNESVIVGLRKKLDPPAGDLSPQDLQAQAILSEFEKVIEEAVRVMGLDPENSKYDEAYTKAVARTKFTWKVPEQF